VHLKAGSELRQSILKLGPCCLFVQHDSIYDDILRHYRENALKRGIPQPQSTQKFDCATLRRHVHVAEVLYSIMSSTLSGRGCHRCVVSRWSCV